jgi:hypothetical protein
MMLMKMEEVVCKMAQTAENTAPNMNGPSRTEYDRDIKDIDEVLSNLVLQFKSLLEHLRGKDDIDDQQFLLTLVTTCPFCGAKEEEGMMYFKKMGEWICLSCGITI